MLKVCLRRIRHALRDDAQAPRFIETIHRRGYRFLPLVTAARRQRLQLRIGERQEAAYGDRTGDIAAELALHFEEGREYARAVHYLCQAAQNALQKSAAHEAQLLLTKAMTLLHRLLEDAARAQQGLFLHILLGFTLVITKGYGSPEVERIHGQAQELSRKPPQSPQLFTALFGLWVFYLVRAELRTAHKLAEQCLQLARQSASPALLRCGVFRVFGETPRRGVSPPSGVGCAIHSMRRSLAPCRSFTD